MLSFSEETNPEAALPGPTGDVNEAVPESAANLAGDKGVTDQGLAPSVTGEGGGGGAAVGAESHFSSDLDSFSFGGSNLQLNELTSQPPPGKIGTHVTATARYA